MKSNYVKRFESVKRLIWIALWASLSANCMGGAIIKEQDMHFGKFAANFTAPSSLQLGYNGDVMTSGPLYVITAAQPARFRLEGFTANHALTVTILDFSLTPDGAGDAFLVKDFVHNTLVTDNNGDALLLVGATLQVGAGNTYPNTDYSGNIQVDIDE